MPTYEYECTKCGRFDKFQKMSDESMKKCPKCKGKIHRLIGSGSGIIFKGSGFYATDYKKPSKEDDSKKACQGPKPGSCKDCSLGKE